MKVLVTGSAGRVGRAIYIHLLRSSHQVVGVDRTPCSTADFVGDIRDTALLSQALVGVDAVVHTAALHAPHVGRLPDSEFQSINVDATITLAQMALQQGIKRFVLTSTTALYGYASRQSGQAAWIDETVTPQPRTIYHRSKIAAEQLLAELAANSDMTVIALQMSRCFPEPVDQMAVYRLNRGVDARDVASAHALALTAPLQGFHRLIISGQTPFTPAQCQALYCDAPAVIHRAAPEVAHLFAQRGWSLPARLDRVYDASAARRLLGWQPQYGASSVVQLFDMGLAEVLPSLAYGVEPVLD